MEEEIKMTETIAEEPVGNTARQELEALLKELLPEEKGGDVDQMALDWIKGQREMNERIVNAMKEDPRMAQVFAEVIDGGKGAASLIRHFGRSYFDAEEGTPEYEEMMAADEEYQNNKAAMAQNQQAFEDKARAFFAGLDDYCNRKSLNADVYKVRIVDEVLEPALDWVATDEFFDRLVKAVDYEKDTEDAFEAGEIKGRNMNINEMRSKVGDGMPKGLTSQAAPVEQPKRKMNSLLEKALKA